MSENKIEVRCPIGKPGGRPGKLLGKVRDRGEQVFVNESNLMELECDFCSDEYKRQGKPGLRILHCYNILGEFIETLIESKTSRY